MGKRQLSVDAGIWLWGRILYPGRRQEVRQDNQNFRWRRRAVCFELESIGRDAANALPRLSAGIWARLAMRRDSNAGNNRREFQELRSAAKRFLFAEVLRRRVELSRWVGNNEDPA